MLFHSLIDSKTSKVTKERAQVFCCSIWLKLVKTDKNLFPNLATMELKTLM